jgi:hypothetical protein
VVENELLPLGSLEGPFGEMVVKFYKFLDQFRLLTEGGQTELCMVGDDDRAVHGSRRVRPHRASTLQIMPFGRGGMPALSTLTSDLYARVMDRLGAKALPPPQTRSFLMRIRDQI